MIVKTGFSGRCFNSPYLCLKFQKVKKGDGAFEVQSETSYIMRVTFTSTIILSELRYRTGKRRSLS